MEVGSFTMPSLSLRRRGWCARLGLSSQFLPHFTIQPAFMSAVIIEKWLQDFVRFSDPAKQICLRTYPYSLQPIDAWRVVVSIAHVSTHEISTVNCRTTDQILNICLTISKIPRH